MRNFMFLLVVALTFSSCNSDDDATFEDGDYLIFGHFYGMCVGETCVETFKLTDNRLYEDSLDDYTATDFKFYQLGQDLFDQVKDLKNDFPEQLLLEDETFFGCPDCADGGGLLIQLFKDGKLYTWKIDQMKENVPEYLHDFMDKVNAKIALIND